jgi:signal transduction histidine kinase
MTGLRSLKTRFVIGSVLWTLGLLGASHLAFVSVTRFAPHILVIQHWTVIGVLAVAFMLGGLSQVRRGLAPVNDLRTRLAALRQGRATRLEGNYPSEVQPLVDDLNALLEHREEAVRRAQAKAGDLAHGLKTPLAVLAQDAARAEQAGLTELAASIRGEIEGMRRQVETHLAQARAAASAAAPGARCLVSASVEPLVRTLRRLYAERGLALDHEAPADLAVTVERHDLDEMLGNLLDNACKWARHQVTLHAAPDGAGAVLVAVEDDGEGLPEEMWTRVLSRGVRADQFMPGSGLGLAIARDLAEVYRGSLTLGRARLGGLRAELRLPRVAD